MPTTMKHTIPGALGRMLPAALATWAVVMVFASDAQAQYVDVDNPGDWSGFAELHLHSGGYIDEGARRLVAR